MRLKCIGGPNHGRYENVPNYYGDGDLARLVTWPEAEINTKVRLETIEITYNIYIVDTIKYNDGKNKEPHKFKFLRHEAVSLTEALRIALVY